jgi:hypothetical protein
MILRETNEEGRMTIDDGPIHRPSIVHHSAFMIGETVASYFLNRTGFSGELITSPTFAPGIQDL